MESTRLLGAVRDEGAIVDKELNHPVTRISGRAGFNIGALAGVAMVLFMVALRFALDTPVLYEVTADWLTKVTPAFVFDFALERLQVSAKPLMFASILMAQVIVGGGLGILYAVYSPSLPLAESRTWSRGLLLAVGLWLLTVAVITPIIEGGFFALSLPDGARDYLITAFIGMLAYALVLTHLHTIALERKAGSFSLGRRTFLERAAFFALLIGSGGLALRTIVRNASSVTPSRAFSTQGELPPEITPNDRFYEVSKNIINPSVDATDWNLEVGGDMVGNPYSLTYDELKALPSKEEFVTLTCISNTIGGSLISNALWRGVPLNVLLERARLDPSVEKIAFHAEDGYVDSFPLEIAMRDNVLVAYLMNGVPLADGHGFPARIIVPGLWGMENVKWLTKIMPVKSDFRGYWQERGWADSATINTMSRIDVPSSGEKIPLQEILVGGIAFAGDRSVIKAEISIDGGTTWQPAELRKALSPYTWALWSIQWTPPAAQRYSITVRATDGTGEVQTAVTHQALPDGATGHDSLIVRVEEQV